MHRIFDFPTPSGALVIAGKTAVIYAFLIVGLRLLGKRELGQMSLQDLVMIVVLGNAVQNAMINNDNTLGGGLVAAGVLLVMNRALNEAVVRSKPVERLMVGEPALIVHDGAVLRARMDQEGLTMDQLSAALREHGLDRLDEVHSAVLEVDGTISVVPRQAAVMRTRRHYRGLRLP